MPRFHQVEAVLEKNRPRYSIFGWYLLPGKLYELNLGNKNTSEKGGKKILEGRKKEKEDTERTMNKKKNKKRRAAAVESERENEKDSQEAKKGEEQEEKSIDRDSLPHCKLAQRILAAYEKSKTKKKKKTKS